MATPTVHISARLAWHDDGWNGRVCRDPKANTYCVGQSSYPGEVIAQQRDLEWETRDDVAGCRCSDLGGLPPCIYSVNAFSEHSTPAYSDPPDFFYGGERRDWELPPATSCIWPYEEMYSDAVADGQGYHDATKRLAASREFFDALEADRTLIFYYANYSNPFSEDDARRYVLVGVSRLKAKGGEMFYDGVPEEAKERHGGFVWGRDITSHYPDQGFRLPYHRFRNQPDVLERFVVVPANPRNFKYGTRHVSDDDALTLVEQLLGSVSFLAEIDGEERWEDRSAWLSSVVAELWSGRGLYPGMLRVLDLLKFDRAIPWYREQIDARSESDVKDEVYRFLDAELDQLSGIALSASETKAVRRRWSLREDDERRLLCDALPRFDLTRDQMERIVSERRASWGIQTSLKELVANPYALVEEYAGDGPDDTIPFSKIDNGAIPSPELGGTSVVEVDDWRRLRAACAERLRREPAHAFASATQVIHDVNERMSYLPAWKRHHFTERYLEVDQEELREALTMRREEERNYLYRRPIYEDERAVEDALRDLGRRPDIELQRPLTLDHWRGFLRNPQSPVASADPRQYDRVIDSQADVCDQIFRRPLCVVCGDAGTGKTTIVSSLIDAIERTEGAGSSFQLLAPTGKAADRLRDRTGRGASTIHSFLASQGFLNENLTFRRYGKRQEGVSTYIVDECSMLDLELLAALFRAIEWESVRRLILVGDPSQLPPIGTGKAFADMIEWLAEEGPESVGRLNENVRQLENRVLGHGTGILDLAQLYVREERLNADAPERKAKAEGVMRRLQEGGDIDRDLRVIYWPDAETLEQILMETIVRDIETDTGETFDPDQPWQLWSRLWNLGGDGRYDRFPENQQVISPYRGELFGTEHLNAVLQDHANGRTVRGRGSLGGITYFDKVIQIRNSSSRNPVYAYDASTRQRGERPRVFNGELGFTKPHGLDNKTWRRRRLRRFQVQLRGKEHLWIDMSSAGTVEANLELAYSISVHKSQGSEFERVYFVVPKHKQALLTTELFYTGVTRARRHCTLLVEEDMGALLSLRRRERSQLNRINSSLFKFAPVPDELLALDDWYEEGKIHRTLSGHLVRSKSEVIIANLLHDRGVPFNYEAPVFARDGTFYLPDFAVTAAGKTWYWEHWGRLDLESYANHVETKREWYAKFFPDQLIETEESTDLSLEAARLIERHFS